MSASRHGTILLIVSIAIGFGIELATNSVEDDLALLKLGALPDNGQLNGEFWRIATYSFLHYNWLHSDRSACDRRSARQAAVPRRP